MKNIKTIDTWHLHDTSEKEYQRSRVTMMDPTSRNMHTLMLKINELTEQINRLAGALESFDPELTHRLLTDSKKQILTDSQKQHNYEQIRNNYQTRRD